MTSQLYCPEDKRRQLLRDTSVNGIDYLEVLPSRRALAVHCFRAVGAIDAENVLISGGVRVRSVRAVWATAADDPALPGLLRPDELGALQGVEHPQRVLVVRTDSSGDFSSYSLRLVETRSAPDRPPAGFDPILSTLAFSFKVDCDSEFDCAPDERDEEPSWPAPRIDYLAKDYASFRRLMLDRLSVLMPDWRERNPADVLVALVELLAYAGDSLSYFQDAVATEAYIGTARRRESVRRHARLLDYRLHDGANARTWICFEAAGTEDGTTIPSGTPVLTGESDAPTTLAEEDVPAAVTRGAAVFETMSEVELRSARNAIAFYTWGDDRCCLPAGATRATLTGSAAVLALRAGDVLVFEEVLSADEDNPRPEDADRTHRHAVRLCKDPEQRVDQATGVTVVEIEWHAADALPFTLCLWEHRDESGDPARTSRTSVAHGNVAVADHGRTLKKRNEHGQFVREREPLHVPIEGRRFRPVLERTGLTQAVPYDDDVSRKRPASEATAGPGAGAALPAIAVVGEGELWEPLQELLNSDRFASSFVVEMHEDGRASLRFGDGVVGREPAPGAEFFAAYRIGGGRAGNVGADTLLRVATTAHVDSVRNPLAAIGGTDPEPIDRARLYAPQAFHGQRRAVTEADYVTRAEEHPEVQRAGATRRWTGSWYTIFLTVDRVGGGPIDADFERRLRAHLEPFRLAAHDLEIDSPRFVSLELALTVCVHPGYERGSVKIALLEALGSGRLPNGERAFFHPDNFTFGQPVYLSRIIATAMGVPGVAWVEAKKFQRFREPPGDALDTARIEFGRLEIARLDNDPNRPEHGRLELTMVGGG